MFKMSSIPPAMAMKIGKEILLTAAFKLERGEGLTALESVLIVQLLRSVAEAIEKEQIPTPKVQP